MEEKGRRGESKKDLRMEARGMMSCEMDQTCMAGFGGGRRGPGAKECW